MSLQNRQNRSDNAGTSQQSSRAQLRSSQGIARSILFGLTAAHLFPESEARQSKQQQKHL
ncbi:MAG: hypothetical protein ABIK45_09535 [Pseudomonadota bacterium]